MKAFLMSVEINDTKEMLYIISETDTIPYSKAETPIVDKEYLKKIHRKVHFIRNEFYL